MYISYYANSVDLTVNLTVYRIDAYFRLIFAIVIICPLLGYVINISGCFIVFDSNPMTTFPSVWWDQ